MHNYSKSISLLTRIGHVPRLHSVGSTLHLSKQVLKSRCPCNEPLAHLTPNFILGNKLPEEGSFPNCHWQFSLVLPAAIRQFDSLWNKPRKKTSIKLIYFLGDPNENTKVYCTVASPEACRAIANSIATTASLRQYELHSPSRITKQKPQSCD